MPAAAASSPQFDVHELAAVSAAVDRSGVGASPGTWTRHPTALSSPLTVPCLAAELATIKRSCGRRHPIQIKHATGVFAPLVSPGGCHLRQGYRCSLGFNVVQGGTYYFLTAGHCGKVAKTWWTSANHTTLIGPTQRLQLPRRRLRAGALRQRSLSHPGGFTAADAFVGESVTRDGSTTGVHTGRVTALNVTVRYQGGGTVRGHDPDQRLRGAGRLRRPAVRRDEGPRPHLRRQR